MPDITYDIGLLVLEFKRIRPNLKLRISIDLSVFRKYGILSSGC
jgi:hypothetical protein